METDDLPLLRGAAYRMFGVFRVKQFLDREGVRGPANQFGYLFLALKYGLGRVNDFRVLRDDIGPFMQEVLRDTIRTCATLPQECARTVSMLTDDVQSVVAWDGCMDFSELVNCACADAYQRAAIRLSWLGTSTFEVLDLAVRFLERALPRAARRFDLRKGRGSELAWLETVFYRYAVKILVADRVNRRQLIALQAGIPDHFEPDDQEPLNNIVAAFERLPSSERKALELYYGLYQRPATISEVAHELTCSEYHARAAIIDGLMRLASSSGIQADLSDKEFGFLSSFLATGEELDVSAREFGIDRSEALLLLKSVRQKFSRSLRRRTGIPSVNQQCNQSSEQERRD
jgi:DNA-directed RNA polymerase specialized sigma24 family protein